MSKRTTAETTKQRHGESFYKEIGRRGGQAYRERQAKGIAKPRGFAAMDRAKVVAAGKRGGSASKRGRAENYEVK